MTLQLPAIDSRSAVSWSSPASGLWVATRRGEYAGMVERLDGSYHARSARGRALGSFEDLDSARAVIDRGHEAPQGAPRVDTRGSQVTAVLWGINAGAVLAALALAFVLLR